MMGLVLGNTLLSTVPGISAAGQTPEKTLYTPILDAELVTTGSITSMPLKPNTPTGCPTPAAITRAMSELTGIQPVFINAGLEHTPTVPCIDMYGDAGRDPRTSDAVPHAEDLFRRGELTGAMLGRYSDLLVLGECVPGGTTTALCVLRALGYDACVSSSFTDNPTSIKEEVWNQVLRRIEESGVHEPLDAIRICGDPMQAVAAGIASAYSGEVILAGGTQMLAVAATLRQMGKRVPTLATTVYVRDDESASFERTLEEVGATACYVDPGFGELDHQGLARYCTGEVKEGTGAGGALMLAYLMGHSEEEISGKVLNFVRGYT